MEAYNIHAIVEMQLFHSCAKRQLQPPLRNTLLRSSIRANRFHDQLADLTPHRKQPKTWRWWCVESAKNGVVKGEKWRRYFTGRRLSQVVDENGTTRIWGGLISRGWRCDLGAHARERVKFKGRTGSGGRIGQEAGWKCSLEGSLYQLGGVRAVLITALSSGAPPQILLIVFNLSEYSRKICRRGRFGIDWGCLHAVKVMNKCLNER